MTQFHAKDIVPLIDLTSLNDNDTPESIVAMCKKAKNAQGEVAAVCIYPHLIEAARKGLDEAGIKDVAIATVVNFPQGRDSLDDVVKETNDALLKGAQEIDVVLPYQAMIDGDEMQAKELVSAVCQAAHAQNALVKVILETGALEDKKHIVQACQLAIEAGADFLKTSTGKIKVGATLRAVDVMLESISAEGLSREIGVKISGGVRTTEEAQSYLELIASRMGKEWINPQHVRIGASSLLNDLLK